MTIQKAFEIIKDEMPYESGIINEALKTVENAVKKQIPKKPIEKDIGKLKFSDTAFCPICDNPVIKDETDNYEQAYCCYCG
jgi:hypothetical protein